MSLGVDIEAVLDMEEENITVTPPTGQPSTPDMQSSSTTGIGQHQKQLPGLEPEKQKVHYKSSPEESSESPDTPKKKYEEDPDYEVAPQTSKKRKAAQSPSKQEYAKKSTRNRPKVDYAQRTLATSTGLLQLGRAPSRSPSPMYDLMRSRVEGTIIGAAEGTMTRSRLADIIGSAPSSPAPSEQVGAVDSTSPPKLTAEVPVEVHQPQPVRPATTRDPSPAEESATPASATSTMAPLEPGQEIILPPKIKVMLENASISVQPVHPAVIKTEPPNTEPLITITDNTGSVVFPDFPKQEKVEHQSQEPMDLSAPVPEESFETSRKNLTPEERERRAAAWRRISAQREMGLASVKDAILAGTHIQQQKLENITPDTSLQEDQDTTMPFETKDELVTPNVSLDSSDPLDMAATLNTARVEEPDSSTADHQQQTPTPTIPRKEEASKWQCLVDSVPLAKIRAELRRAEIKKEKQDPATTPTAPGDKPPVTRNLPQEIINIESDSEEGEGEETGPGGERD